MNIKLFSGISEFLIISMHYAGFGVLPVLNP
jgi:hypothetical protein